MSQELTAKLLTSITALGKDRALFPFADAEIDEIIEELENLNSSSQPLQIDNRKDLLGNWELIYASNGTVVTRQIAETTKIFGSGIKVEKVWQSLTIDDGIIKADNQALVELFLLGEYRVSAQGIWQPEADLRTATVTFEGFTVQATKLFNQPEWTLPQLEIPVLDWWQNSALWITSYLDENMRIGRGKTGNLFIFQRLSN